MTEARQADGKESSINFASLLASLTTVGRKEEPWDDSALEQDVTTLSYEQALKSQMRGQTPRARSAAPVRHSRARVQRDKAGSRKNASITIRLGEEEAAQLRARAAEAGITVSEYLRSCALEAESLRTQVRQTLAELRESAPRKTEPEKQRAAVEQRESALSWRERLLPHWFAGRGTATAQA